MKPIPVTNHHIHELIQMRWSPRAFTETPVEQSKINSLFEAARWSPSCANEQPWSFIYATQNNQEAFHQLFDCLDDRNQLWTKTVPMLILTIAHTRFERNNKPNPYALYDLGQSVMNMIVQATSMELHVHQMAGFSKEKARETFHIPEYYEPVSMIAVGYHGDINRLHEDFTDAEYKPQVRKKIESFVKKWEIE
ncbi:MAG: nitroreductase family protein [Bacteroidia bacterium]|nr:nitroreductase family protein [Bacteroidia bacterium]